MELARELARRYPPDPRAPRGVPEVLRSGRSELYEDIPDHLLVQGARDAEHLRILRELELRSAMVVPMTARERTLGTLSFFAAESGRRYGPSDLAMAEELARRAALAIDNARIYEAAQQTARAREEAVAVVAHDLKNPLNAALMSATLLARQAGDPEKVAHHAASLQRSIRRMATLVRDLLSTWRASRRGGSSWRAARTRWPRSSPTRSPRWSPSPPRRRWRSCRRSARRARWCAAIASGPCRCCRTPWRWRGRAP